MKNFKMIKSLLILIMSIGVILIFSNLVYATDDDPFIQINSTSPSSNESNNTEANNTESNNTDTGNLFSNINTSNNTSNSIATNNNTVNNTTNTLTNTNTANRSVSNTNTLAKTGLTDSKGMITLIVLVCGISAVYSYKKISDYKKL